MTPRPSLRSVGTTVAAAAVLVAGANLASYAATGNALVLGHHNSAGTTTALKNTGRGPALSLNSIKSAPPLVVNSKKMVKHLNANCRRQDREPARADRVALPRRQGHHADQCRSALLHHEASDRHLRGDDERHPDQHRQHRQVHLRGR